MERQECFDSETINSYLEHLHEEERSDLTVEKYNRDIVRFFAFSRGVLDRAGLLAWKAQLIQAGYAPQTINSMLAAVNGLFDFLGHGAQKVKPVKCQRAVFRAKERELTKAEYMRLLHTAQQQGKQRLFLVMQTICATGIRVSELKYITAEAIRTGRATVSCKGKCRSIIIPRKLCKQLRKWVKDKKISAGPVFQTSRGNPLDRSNIWREMKGLCKAAGVDSEKVFPHNLRHLFATVFYEADKDIAKLADVLGHTSINTTRIYIMESGAEHERQMARLGLVI